MNGRGVLKKISDKIIHTASTQKLFYEIEFFVANFLETKPILYIRENGKKSGAIFANCYV
jgi:hypothetical protein